MKGNCISNAMKDKPDGLQTEEGKGTPRQKDHMMIAIDGSEYVSDNLELLRAIKEILEVLMGLADRTAVTSLDKENETANLTNSDGL